ncbi:hypothetical protein R0I01_07230 [Bacillus pumilus]|nr:hypothetical protein R0I01_07230 [Bacillus pumilus]
MQKNQKALIIVDVQKAFEHEKWGERNNLDAEKNISRLLTFWREKGWTVDSLCSITSDKPDSLFHRQMRASLQRYRQTRLEEETGDTKEKSQQLYWHKLGGTVKVKPY